MTAPAIKPKRPTKWIEVLQTLATGRSLNRFDAERLHHDHCLNSTISGIEAMGVKVARSPESVPGAFGKATHVKRYFLEADQVEKARELIASRTARVGDIGGLETAAETIEGGRS